MKNDKRFLMLGRKMIKAKYKHTNIVAREWGKLAEFYQRILGCIPVPPDRASTGEWVKRCTGVPGVEVRGVHLRLPGYGDDGPTLEIFQYNIVEKRLKTAINRPGLAHLGAPRLQPLVFGEKNKPLIFGEKNEKTRIHYHDSSRCNRTDARKGNINCG